MRRFLRRWGPDVLVWIAYVDVVAGVFATFMGLDGVAGMLCISGLSLVVAAVCFDVLVATEDRNGQG